MRAWIVMAVLAGCANEPAEQEVVTDPGGFGARGIVDLAPGVSADGYAFLVVWLSQGEPDLRDPFEPRQQSPLPEQWPAEFRLHSGFTGPAEGEWTLYAWLATAPAEAAPGPGAPHAQHDVLLCVDETYPDPCDVSDLTLELAP